MNPKPLTILLAAIIGTAAAAHDVQAPPEIVAAAKAAADYAEHVISFGTRCKVMTLHGYNLDESCIKMGKAAVSMDEHASIALGWINAEIEKGATTSSNMPRIGAVDDAVDVINEVVRAREYN